MTILEPERQRERIPAELRRSAGSDDGHVRSRDLKRDTHRWARWVHVYASMIALVVVLFFGLTGITLNHPDWTFGDDVDVTSDSGELPFAAASDDGTVDFLAISEYIRDEYGVTADVDSYSETNGQASIAYKNAGYAADVFVDVESGTYDVTIEQQGWVAVMNDLHKGRDTGSAWRWVIDLSAGFLVVVSLTGLLMQFFLRKRRRSALVSAAVGGAVVVALVWLTLH